MKDFVHLHQHTEFSLLDGLGKTDNILKRAKEIGQTALAITDHGTCGGHFNFKKHAEAEKIKPILGCEVYVVEDHFRRGFTDQEKEEYTKGFDEKEHKKVLREKEKELKIRKSNHLVILATNEIGLTNVNKIASEAAVNGYYYRPRIDYKFIAENKEGIIVLSACLAGIVPQFIMENDFETAENYVIRFKEIFGENYYLEIQPNGLPQQQLVNKTLIQFAKKHDIKWVATNDNHYILKEDKKVHDTLLLLKQKLTWADIEKIKNEKEEGDEDGKTRDKALLFSVKDLYLKSYDEMFESFKYNDRDISDKDVITALDNTVEIASRCIEKHDFNKKCFPGVKIPDKYEDTIKQLLVKYKLEDNETNRKISYFRALINEGWAERIEGKILEEKEEEYTNRLKYEFEVITQKGFVEYFLVVSEFIRWAKDHDIMTGPARGSAAGSLISYLLWIIDIDPIPFGLYFERFLNPQRNKIPDIDTDFQDDKREIVRDHIIAEYGESRVAQVVAYSTMSINMCFRDVSRVFSLPLEISNEIAKQLVTQGEQYKSYLTIEKNFEMLPILKQYFEEPIEKPDDKPKDEATKKIENHIAIIRSEYGPLIKEIFSIVMRMQHQVRHASIAAAASVITEKEIYNYCSLRRTKDGLAVEWDGIMISKTGILKMDILGIKCLKIIKETLNLLKTKGINVDLYDLEILKDKDAIELFRKGETLASFQFDGHGIREVLKSMKPTCFEDIIAAAALFRPGPLSSGLVETFCKRKNGDPTKTEEEIKNQHFLKLFDEILKDTYGVVVYQEQLIFLFHKVFGLDMGDADLLRRAIDEVNAKGQQFYIDKIKANLDKSQIKDEKTMNEALTYIGKISGYSFNKSHSCAYAYVAFWTMYLKAHYPLEFGLATINNRMDSHELVKDFQKIWREKCGVDFVSIDANKSKDICTYYEEEKKVYAGILMLRGVGQSFCKKLIAKQPFKSVEAFATAKMFSKVGFDALIKLGGLDKLMQLDLKENEVVNRRVLYYAIFANQYKLDYEKITKNMTEEEFLKLPRRKKIEFKEAYEKIRTMGIEDYNHDEKVKNEKQYFETLLFSSVLKKKDKQLVKDYQTMTGNKIFPFSRLLEDNSFEQKVVFLFGEVESVEERVSANKNVFYYVNLDDGDNKIKCLVWKQLYDTNTSKLKQGNRILIVAKRSTWKEKYISFLIENKYEEHGVIMSFKQIENFVNRDKEAPGAQENDQ